jgi:hypothetical protein
LSPITVKLAAHVFVSHELVTVKVTVLVPPLHALGAAPPLLVTLPRAHPPVALAEASQLLYAVFTPAWEVQAATVVLTAQLSTTAGAGFTVKLAEHVFVSHVLVTVNVTVLVPPAHASGAPPSLLVTEPRLHPPVAVAEASQLV